MTILLYMGVGVFLLFSYANLAAWWKNRKIRKLIDAAMKEIAASRYFPLEREKGNILN